MKILKTLIISFILVYVLISLPSILGFRYTIDWIDEATMFQRFKGYVVVGLTNGYEMKSLIALLAEQF